MIPIGQVIAELFNVLDELQIRFVVGGSFASGAWGNPRQTNDIDIAVRMTARDSESLIKLLGDDWISSEEEILRTLNEPDEFRMFQLLHVPSVFKVDVFVPHDDEFSQSYFRRVEVVDFLGTSSPCLSAEDIVIQKLRWYELGNRISDRQWNDIVQILELRGALIDSSYLDQWAIYFKLDDLLELARKQIRHRS